MRYSRLESKSGIDASHTGGTVHCTVYREGPLVVYLLYGTVLLRAGSPPPKLIKFTTRGHSVLYIYFLYCISICSFYIHILTLWYMCTLYIYFLYCISAHCIYTFSIVYLPTVHIYILSLWYICPHFIYFLYDIYFTRYCRLLFMEPCSQ